MKVPDIHVGKKLMVGSLPPLLSSLGEVPPKPAARGSAIIEGPTMLGSPISFPSPESNVMIGRCLNSDTIPPPISLLKIRNAPLIKPLPTDIMLGDPAGPCGITCFSGTSAFTIMAGSYVKIAALSENITAKIDLGTKYELGIVSSLSKAFNLAPLAGSTFAKFEDLATGLTTLNKTFALVRTKKTFDIKHPSKEGWRLRYVCLEGPDAEVYIRGRLKNSNYIELPDYWKDLVDADSITVNLTSIGTYQELFYKEIEWGTRIKVMNSAGGPINCSYTVYGKRKDTTKNITEYEGLTVDDYPGDNNEYAINK